MLYRGGPETAGAGLPWPDARQALLMQAAIGPDSGVREAYTAWRSQTDIDAVIDGGSFRLLPLVYSRLQPLQLDDPLMARLKGLYRRSWADTHTLMHDTRPVLEALHQAGIRTLLLKGAPLVLVYYRNYATRPMHDLDIVVAPEDFPRAVKVLGGIGWSLTEEYRAGMEPYFHSAPLKDGRGRKTIDLHWFCLQEALYAEASNWFWSTARPLDFDGIPTLQPSPTALLVHVIIHGTRSDKEPPIRWVADTATIIRHAGDELDWEALAAFAKANKLTRRISLGLDYVADAYGVPVPTATREALRAAGTTLVERIENLSYLRSAELTVENRVVTLFANYLCRMRLRGPLAFFAGLPAFLTYRWQLKHPLMIPVGAVHRVWRVMRRQRQAAVHS